MHAYDKHGNPQHFLPDGRPTTLREVRKYKWVPGTTDIIAVQNRPGLNQWIVNNAVMACLTLPRLPDESLEDFKDRALKDAKEQSDKAMADGTAIHKQVEDWFKGVTVQETPHVMAVLEALRTHGLSTEGWVAERRFASPMGYGGAVDLSCPGVVADVKSKQDWKDVKSLAWPEMCQQLTAYSHGLGQPNSRLLNIFVSVKEPVQVHIHEWGEEDKLRNWEIFKHLLEVWKLSKKYDSSEAFA